jgi:hypothetical protein
MNALSPITNAVPPKCPTIEQRLQSVIDDLRAIPDVFGIDTELLGQAETLVELAQARYESRHEPMDALTVHSVQARIGRAA